MKINPLVIALFPAQYKHANSLGELNFNEFKGSILASLLLSVLIGVAISVFSLHTEKRLIDFVLSIFNNSIITFLLIGNVINLIWLAVAYLSKKIKSFIVVNDSDKDMSIGESLKQILHSTFKWQSSFANSVDKHKEGKSMAFLLLIFIYLLVSLFAVIIIAKQDFGVKAGYDYPILLIFLVSSLLNNFIASVVANVYKAATSLFEDDDVTNETKDRND